MSDNVRILRLLEYSGPRTAVEDAIRMRGVKGEKTIASINLTIREGLLGDVVEVLEDAEPPLNSKYLIYTGEDGLFRFVSPITGKLSRGYYFRHRVLRDLTAEFRKKAEQGKLDPQVHKGEAPTPSPELPEPSIFTDDPEVVYELDPREYSGIFKARDGSYWYTDQGENKFGFSTLCGAAVHRRNRQRNRKSNA